MNSNWIPVLCLLAIGGGMCLSGPPQPSDPDQGLRPKFIQLTDSQISDSPEWAPFPGMSTKLKTTGGPIFILARTGGLATDADFNRKVIGQITFRLVVDGVEVSTMNRLNGPDLNRHSEPNQVPREELLLFALIERGPGEHEIGVEWRDRKLKSTAGIEGNARSLVAFELTSPIVTERLRHDFGAFVGSTSYEIEALKKEVSVLRMELIDDSKRDKSFYDALKNEILIELRAEEAKNQKNPAGR